MPRSQIAKKIILKPTDSQAQGQAVEGAPAQPSLNIVQRLGRWLARAFRSDKTQEKAS